MHFQVFDLVKLTELYYAGSHGMDIIGPFSQTLSNNHPNCVSSTDHQVSINGDAIVVSCRSLLFNVPDYVTEYRSSLSFCI